MRDINSTQSKQRDKDKQFFEYNTNKYKINCTRPEVNTVMSENATGSQNISKHLKPGCNG